MLEERLQDLSDLFSEIDEAIGSDTDIEVDIREDTITVDYTVDSIGIHFQVGIGARPGYMTEGLEGLIPYLRKLFHSTEGASEDLRPRLWTSLFMLNIEKFQGGDLARALSRITGIMGDEVIEEFLNLFDKKFGLDDLDCDGDCENCEKEH